MSKYMQSVLKRGFNVEDYSKNWYALADSMAYYCWNDYVPTDDEKHLLRIRICERTTASKKERFSLLWKANI